MEGKGKEQNIVTGTETEKQCIVVTIVRGIEERLDLPLQRFQRGNLHYKRTPKPYGRNFQLH